MKVISAPKKVLSTKSGAGFEVVLYGQPVYSHQGSAGEAVKNTILRNKLDPASRAWDFLSLALSVVTADFAIRRDDTVDGWTREIELEIAVADVEFWLTQSAVIEQALAFLTTDRWKIDFTPGGKNPGSPKKAQYPIEDCVALLSGGLDSLVGVLDLVEEGKAPFVSSHVVTGDKSKQIRFAQTIGGGLQHLQVNHNANVPGSAEKSQRARSIFFLAVGLIAATSLAKYRDGAEIKLYVCENGYIALNPPLTDIRIGSLSTRTAHPIYLSKIQDILTAANLNVRIENPYEFKTKGEMLSQCKDQTGLSTHAAASTSCGRFQRFNYKHCGRCVPCQVRRAAFLAWGRDDTTTYVHKNLGLENEEHAGFDDVRSVAMALAEIEVIGTNAWAERALPFFETKNKQSLISVIERGMSELGQLHRNYGVK